MKGSEVVMAFLDKPSGKAERRQIEQEEEAATVSQHRGQKRRNGMTQEERWNLRYQEAMAFIETNHRNPSKHRIEEHDMLNWMKANRKALNAGKLKEKRVEAFKRLLEMSEQYRRVNQWE